MLSTDHLRQFEADGHVTVPHVFDGSTLQAALDDVDQWGREFLAQLPAERREWFLERADTTGLSLRKLDEPVYHRAAFRTMARSPRLLSMVEQIIGKGVSVFFSQVFCKAAEVGGPKPVHQDNFYFGPSDPNATLTVWIALDEATEENGCLFYGDGSHLGPIYPHVAPPEEPFNLQIPPESLHDYVMSPAPVPAGGVSFHHGNTWHQSSSNRSSRPRRAAAFHFLRNDATLEAPALDYDPAVCLQLTSHSGR